MLQAILAPAGFSDRVAGVFGFLNSVGLNVGALASASLADRCCRRRLKRLIAGAMVALALVAAWWSWGCCYASLPAALGGGGGGAGRAGAGALGGAILVMGLAQGCADPLFYELGAELTYPASEAVSGAVLVLVWNTTTLVVLALPPSLGRAMNWIWVGGIGACLVLVASVRERYLRPADGPLAVAAGAH